MEVINNISRLVRDDLAETILPRSRVSIAAACFSLYAYQELKKQLSRVDECRFIFTSPTFVKEKQAKEKREFYIPRLDRERSLYGTEFEVKLRNELTQRAIAQECAEWIRKKATFKSNRTQEGMQGFLNVENGEETSTYMPFNGFTTVDLGCDRGRNVYNMVTKFSAPASTEFVRLFDRVWNDKTRMEDVTEEVVESISAVYQENAPELIYFVTLYHIFSEFLEDLNEDVLPNEATGFRESLIWKKLYAFQRDAALGIINKLEQYNGCILADSVGLGKTFTALAVIKYYEGRNKNVLVLCPKKLKDNWITFRANLVNNPLGADRLRYDILFHTDLSRERGETVTGLPIERINWGNYDLVVIDESHNFRNGGELGGEDGLKENRYLRLMNRVIRAGVKTKVLMLSATPVNNRFIDLRNQIALAYEGESTELDRKLNTKSDIDTIFRHAQSVFNAWSNRPPEERTTAALLRELDFDFFELLDAVTIARSRRHIQNYYDTTEIGTFPERLPPVSVRPQLTDLETATYADIYAELNLLNLKIYTPTAFIHPSRLSKYVDPESKHGKNLSQAGRERGIQRLMSINLLKRMESSVHSFRLTVERIFENIRSTIRVIDAFASGDLRAAVQEMRDLSNADFDLDDQNQDIFTVGRKFRIDLRDMDHVSWRAELTADVEVLSRLLKTIDGITPAHDSKLCELKSLVKWKLGAPINDGNRKILIFTAFSDTAEYLYENLAAFVRAEFGLNVALVTGTIDGRTTIPRFPADMNTILTCFSPRSKERDLVFPKSPGDIDVLIATDCISEGQNLQDCDTCINYDIHWNPVRIIQRFGRIDRIGSVNKRIQLVNFWPDLELDEYINLKARVEARMRISVMTSTGDDDYINAAEKGDLQYRRQQLERLQKEVVDLEEMTSGISIMDLGLNDFRMDLLAYLKTNPNLERTPLGIHAVVHGEKPGIVFVLKNVNQGVNVESRNRLHPFYLVFIGDDGAIIGNHLQAKETLDALRLLARGQTSPNRLACRAFNEETKDGREMRRVSELLRGAISSIVTVKEESDIDSLFTGGGTSALLSKVSGLDDFELVTFLVVKKGGEVR